MKCSSSPSAQNAAPSVKADPPVPSREQHVALSIEESASSPSPLAALVKKSRRVRWIALSRGAWS